MARLCAGRWDWTEGRAVVPLIKDRLSDHRVDRPRATKSAGKINKALAGAASDDDGAGAAPVEGDESVLLQHENAQHEEACGSK